MLSTRRQDKKSVSDPRAPELILLPHSLLPVSMQDHPPPPALLAAELSAPAGSPAVGCKVPYQLCRSDRKPSLSSLARLLPSRGCLKLQCDEHHPLLEEKDEEVGVMDQNSLGLTKLRAVSLPPQKSRVLSAGKLHWKLGWQNWGNMHSFQSLGSIPAQASTPVCLFSGS